MCEICSKLEIKTPDGRRSGDFIVNFEQDSQLLLQIVTNSVSIVDFK